MTSLSDALGALRGGLLGSVSGDTDALGSAIDLTQFREPDVTAGPGGTAALVTVRPVESVTVEQLSGILGPVLRLPRSPGGGPRTVLFSDTLPGDGETGATVLAEIDESDLVQRLVVRADHY